MIDGGEPKQALVTGAESHALPLAARPSLIERLLSTLGWKTEGLLARPRGGVRTPISRLLSKDTDSPMPRGARVRRPAERIGRATERGERTVVFPAPLAVGLALLPLLPGGMASAIARGFRFTVDPP